MTAPDTDRELLVLAAKAAGYKFHENDGQLWVYYDGTGFRIWNPLTDEGDALRLAVKLAKKAGMPFAALIANFLHQEQEQEGDDCAATRRAIVRAAAEIGRAMP